MRGALLKRRRVLHKDVQKIQNQVVLFSVGGLIDLNTLTSNTSQHQCVADYFLCQILEVWAMILYLLGTSEKYMP